METTNTQHMLFSNAVMDKGVNFHIAYSIIWRTVFRLIGID